MKLVKDENKPILENQVTDKEAEESIRKILKWIGEDPSREGLLETPKRVIKAFKEYFHGYKDDPKGILEKTVNYLYDVITKSIRISEKSGNFIVV